MEELGQLSEREGWTAYLKDPPADETPNSYLKSKLDSEGEQENPLKLLVTMKISGPAKTNVWQASTMPTDDQLSPIVAIVSSAIDEMQL